MSLSDQLKYFSIEIFFPSFQVCLFLFSFKKINDDLKDYAALSRSGEVNMNCDDDCANATTTSLIPKVIVRQINELISSVDICNIESDLIIGETYRGPTAITRAFVRSDVAAESTARYQGAGLDGSTEFSESEHVTQGPLVEY